MTKLLVLFVLGQAANTTIADPTFPSSRVTTTASGAKRGLDINCISGCSGAGGGGGSGGDGGATTVNGTVTANQGTSRDGGTTWPIEVSALPLPSGAATAANQTTLGSQTTKLNDGTDTANVTAAGALQVDNSAVTQPISAASLPLPTGAATSANQTGLGSQTTKLNDGTDTANITAAGALVVDGSGATQPVAGTVTANAGTNLNTSLLALDATLTNRTQKSQITDGTRDGTVKAASTAAQAADTSLVVALSPNSPVPTGTNVIGHVIADTGSTTAVTGNVTVTQATGTNLHAVLDTTSTTAVTQATASNLNAQVVGAAASGAAKSGNPVQVGGVFNTTQPTVTNGQAVEAQATARGATIVAPGVDNTATNAWFTKVTDGTTTAAVIAATTALKVDTASVAGTATSTAAAGVQKVGIVGGTNTSLETTAGVLDMNLKNVGNAAVATGNGTAAGSIRVSVASDSTGTIAATQSGNWTTRGVGNAGGVIDAANNGTAPANVWVEGWQLQSGATATAGTAGQVGSPVASLDHVPYARLGGPVTWSCSLDNLGATLTQCQAVGGAGLKYYITDIEIESTTTTAGLFLVRYGTGTNCGTGTTSLFPSAATVARMSYPANTAANPSVFHFLTPLVTAAAQEICIICTATNTCSVQMTGYTAP